MTRPQTGLSTEPNMATSMMPMQYGYLIGVDKAKRTVDVFVRGGGKMYGLPVLQSVGALPDVTPNMGSPTGSEVACVIGYMAGDYRKAIVLGLLLPSNYETLSSEWLVTHPTGLTVQIKTDGTILITRPNGTTVEITNGLVEKTVYSAHMHSDPQGGTTGVPI